jgi:hypothetical protein
VKIKCRFSLELLYVETSKGALSQHRRQTRFYVPVRTMEMGKRDESQVPQIRTWAINEFCVVCVSPAATASSSTWYVGDVGESSTFEAIRNDHGYDSVARTSADPLQSRLPKPRDMTGHFV